jgi:Domain of unknown function (DUF4145)
MRSRLTQLESRIAELEALAGIVEQLANGYGHGMPPGELPLRGEEWYRGARALLVDQSFSGLAEFDLCYAAYVNIDGKTTRINWDIGSFIHAFTATIAASNLPLFQKTFTKARALLRSCASEMKSRELAITTDLSFAVSQDEFETAKNLLESSGEESIVRASGVVARVALERHLLTVADSRAIQIEKNPPNKAKIDVSDVLNALRKQDVITSIQKSELETLFKIGNNCAHPKEPVNTTDVERLIQRARELAAVIL